MHTLPATQARPNISADAVEFLRACTATTSPDRQYQLLTDTDTLLGFIPTPISLLSAPAGFDVSGQAHDVLALLCRVGSLRRSRQVTTTKSVPVELSER